MLLPRNVQGPGTTEQKSLRGPRWDPAPGGQAGGQQAAGSLPGNQSPWQWRSNPGQLGNRSVGQAWSSHWPPTGVPDREERKGEGSRPWQGLAPLHGCPLSPLCPSHQSRHFPERPSQDRLSSWPMAAPISCRFQHHGPPQPPCLPDFMFLTLCYS